MLHDIVEARSVGEYRVFLRFDDGTQGEVDLSAVLTFEGVFATLESPARFSELSLNPELGTICWPNGADVAPETLYSELLRQLPRVTA